MDACLDQIDFIDRNISRDLFMGYLNKVGDYYHDYLGFSLCPSLDLHAILFLAIFLISITFIKWFVGLAIVSLMYSISLYILLKKRRKNAVYGVFY
jgi:hypothetical protein